MANNCLCCQKPLEAEGRYHPRCLHRLFGSTKLPAIPFGLADMPGLVVKTEGRMSISGVQAKASVRLNREKWELEAVATGGTHILKPGADRFPQLPQNENLCMNIAEELGMDVPGHGLFSMADGKLCYLVKRFDRTEDGRKLRKETMFQLLESKDKYSGSLEQVGKAIRTHATNVGLDSISFFERVLLCFLTGNGDMHLKNWALMTREKNTALAPCYDLVCTRIYIANEDDSALTINARKNKLKRSDFETLAAYLKIDPKATANIFDRHRAAQETLQPMCRNSALRHDLQRDLLEVASSRYARLYGGSEA